MKFPNYPTAIGQDGNRPLISLTFAFLLGILSLSCSSSSPPPTRLANSSVRRVAITFSQQVIAGEPVEVGATLTDSFLNQCPQPCPVGRIQLLTSQGELLGELPPGGLLTLNFPQPGLYVVLPRLISQPPGELPPTNVNDLLVVPVLREVGDVLVAADERVLTVDRQGDLVRIYLHLVNAHLKTPQGEELGYLDPAYRQVRIFLIALNGEGEELYRSREASIEVVGEKLLELRHTLREPAKTDSLRVVVGVEKLVPSMRELFITPRSFDLKLPPG